MAGGLTNGKSHAKGGIKMKVKSTGQNIEVEGGEGIINKHTMSSKDKHTFEGKEMTACEIASDLNQKTGNGVSFDCDETKNTDMTPTDPTTGFAKGGKTDGSIKWKKNIGDEGWSSNMKNEAAYENQGGYISEDGDYTISQDVRFDNKMGIHYRSGDWTADYKEKPLTRKMVYGNQFEDETFWFPTLKDAKRFVNQHAEKQFSKGGKPKRKYKKKKMAKSKKKTGAFGKLVSKIMKRDGIPYKQALAKAKDEYVSGATSKKKQPKKSYKGRLDKLKSKAPKKSYSGRPKKVGGVKTWTDAQLMKDLKKQGLKWEDELEFSNVATDKGYRFGVGKDDVWIKSSDIAKYKNSLPDNKLLTKDLNTRKMFRDEDYAKGGKTDEVIMIQIGETGKKKYPYYLKKIDSTHFAMANNKEGVDIVIPSHILQYKGESYYNDVRSWLKGGASPDGKSYDRNYYAEGGELMDADTEVNYAKGGKTLGDGRFTKAEVLSKSIVYDNGGESLDRYTIYTPDGSVYGMSETGGGFNQYVGESNEIPKGKHLGKRLKSVPKDIQSAVVERMTYAKGGDVSGKPVVESIDKIVLHTNGEEFDLDNYPPTSGSDWMYDAMELTLEEAKQFAKELDYELEYSEDVEDAENLQDLQYAILEDTQEKANHDNTYNASWWGGVVDFFVLERKEDDGYGEALVILRMHRGGDPRGNYYGYEAFKLNSFIEDFPAYFARLTYQIKTNQGTITLDTEDMEGYHLLVVEDDTLTFTEYDSVTLDDVEEKLDMNGVSIYAKGGQTKKLYFQGGNTKQTTMDNKIAYFEELEDDMFNDIPFTELDLADINSYDELYNAVDDAGFFNVEVIYYSNAMEYLIEEDTSLSESMGLAADMGYQPENINSELLASLLKSQKLRESLDERQPQIDDFFDELED
jgi:hypothetical protein